MPVHILSKQYAWEIIVLLIVKKRRGSQWDMVLCMSCVDDVCSLFGCDTKHYFLLVTRRTGSESES